MSLFTIINKSLPAQGLALLVGGYNFGHPRKSIRFVGDGVAEVDQESSMFMASLKPEQQPSLQQDLALVGAD